MQSHRFISASFAALCVLSLLVTNSRADEPASQPAVPGLGFTEGADPESFVLPEGSQKNQQLNVTFSGSFKMRKGTREGLLSVRAEIDPGWHVFSVTQPPGGPMASRLAVKSPEVKTTTGFLSDRAPHIRPPEVFPVPSEEHEGEVIWQASIEVTEGTDVEQLKIQVQYDGQVCTDLGSCVPLDEVMIEARFAGYVEQIDAPQEQAPVAAPPSPKPPEFVEKKATLSANMMLLYISLGFLGGLILNLMPCVLPVIGLKILSFAEQAHMNRGAILRLNIWFSLGLISVFLILATLAVAFQMSWGEQFTHTWFKVAMTVVVFAMALSFLGVWEIPIPGFVGRGVANDLQEREDASGAFFKGVFTTILATPCSGPALGAIFPLVVTQPAYVSYLLFCSIGVGMASPYLVIAAFPRLIRFLPKPGAWMETFKNLMGFVLLATVVYLFTTISAEYFASTLALAFGVWLGCWMIGRIPITAGAGQKARGWLAAATVMALATMISFSSGFVAFARGHGDTIAWEPYNPQVLEQHLSEGKTVMVDFTAQWCLTCKLNLYRAIERPEVAALVEKNGVVPILADWTDKNAQIKQALLELNSNSIPVLAIYPAGSKEDVIILRDLIGKQQVLDALEKAGPSKKSATSSEMAARP